MSSSSNLASAAPAFGSRYYLDPNHVKYDAIFAGSSWCLQALRNAGVKNTHLFLQGIDPAKFHTGRGLKERKPGEFIIFSGGKLEYRKGQDLVLVAFREFLKLYPHAKLMISWFNQWPHLISKLSMSKHIHSPPQFSKKTGKLDLTRWFEDHGVPRKSVVILPEIENSEMIHYLGKADVAMYLSRCEGGTNLGAMETIAAGVPTILSANTGHLDLVNSTFNFPIWKQHIEKPEIPERKGWGESDLKEVVRTLSFVYENPLEARYRATLGAQVMKKHWTWDTQISSFMATVDEITSQAELEFS